MERERNCQRLCGLWKHEGGRLFLPWQLHFSHLNSTEFEDLARHGSGQRDFFADLNDSLGCLDLKDLGASIARRQVQLGPARRSLTEPRRYG
jgi:hypothetical protein